MRQKYLLPFFLFLQIGLLQLLSIFPEYVERFYSNGLYVWISEFSRITFGVFPFSIGDVIYFGAIFYVLRWFFKSRNTWRSLWKEHLISILSFLSVFYFLFHLLWGLNYYRVPLFEKMNIKREYSDADLLLFTQKLITKTNALQHQLEKNDSLKVNFPYTQNEVFEMNPKGYQQLSNQYPFFKYENPSIKKSIISLPLSYMGFGGYLNPFTNEAQVNYLGPIYHFPMTTNHEMAHQLGYASESEANFIGFLATVKNEDLYIQYSGYSYALRYCLHNWHNRNEATERELLKTIHLGILKNYQESEDFWNQYETFIESGFELFYDQFLKLNQQEDGLESYSKFVDLMVNYYKNRSL
jgi:hypothetical protein